jgi:hypothetical protein
MAEDAGTVAIQFEAKVDAYNASIAATVRAFGAAGGAMQNSAGVVEAAATRLGAAASAGFQRAGESAEAAAKGVEGGSIKSSESSRKFAKALSELALEAAGSDVKFSSLVAKFPQVVEALEVTKGPLVGFVGFLQGPWGIALTGAAAVVLKLIERMGEFSDKTKEAIKKADESFAKIKSLVEQAERLNYGGIDEDNFRLRMNAQRSVREAEQALVDAKSKNVPGARTRGEATALRGPMIVKAERNLAAAKETLRIVNEKLELYYSKKEAEAALEEKREKSSKSYRQSIISVRDTQAQADAAASAALTERKRVIDEINASLVQAAKSWQDIIAGNANQGIAKIESDINRPGDEKLKAGYQALIDKEAEEKKIKALADFYLQAFNGGTKGLFKQFKEEGLKAVATILAKLTVAQFGGAVGGEGGGGVFGTLFGAIVSAVTGGGYNAAKLRAKGPPLGYPTGGTWELPKSGPLLNFGDRGLSFDTPRLATGGSFRVGGAGGIDGNVMAINGQPVAQVSRGETVAVVPQGKRLARPVGALDKPQGDMRVFNISVSADNSVTPATFGREVVAMALQEAAKMDDATFRRSMANVPARVNRFQQLGS